MDRSTMLKFMHKLNKVFNFFNKHFYILPLFSFIFSTCSNKNNKVVNTLTFIIKFFILINIILGISFIIYFTDFISPVNNTYSMYYDLLEPYIEIMKHFYNKVIIYFNNVIDLVKDFIKDYTSSSSSKSNIENEIKSGIKSGIKEALEEVIDDIEIDNKIKSDIFMKQVIICTTSLFIFYLIVFIPGSVPDDINQYNLINQHLITIKSSIIDLFYQWKPSNPGTGNTGTGSFTPSTVGSPSISTNSTPSSISTILPRVPTLTQYIDAGTQTDIVSPYNDINNMIDSSTQTIVDGTSVSKMIETINILEEVLDTDNSNIIKDQVNKVISKITD